MTTLYKTTGFSAGKGSPDADADWTIQKVEVISDMGRGVKPYILITSGQDEIKIPVEDWSLFKTAVVTLVVMED